MDDPGISVFNAQQISVGLQNNEEDEDLEDQRQRQKDIENYLGTAMTSFDDQSTLSSTNVSFEESHSSVSHTRSNKKYREIDKSVKVLFEVRADEVRRLNEKVKSMENNMQVQKEQYTKKYMLSEANRDRAEISLKQCQDALASKVEEVNHLNHSIRSITSELKSTERKCSDLMENNSALKLVNQDLMDQMRLSKRGLHGNGVNEKIQIENQQQQLNELRSSIESLTVKLDFKEKQLRETEERLKDKIKEKEESCVQQSGQINSLNSHLQSAQAQCRELIEVIDKISQENEQLKEDVMRLRESSKIAAFNGNTLITNSLQKELDKSQKLYQKQYLEFESFQKEYSEQTSELRVTKQDLEECKTKLDVFKDQEMAYEKHSQATALDISNLKKENRLLIRKIDEMATESDNLRKREETMQEKIDLIEKLKHDKSLNLNILDLEITELLNEIKCLKTKFREVENLNEDLQEQIDKKNSEIEQMVFKMNLHMERERLIDDLQNKALQFEQYLVDNKSKQIDCTTVGTNTDDRKCDNEEMITERLEAELINREIDLREKLQQEFLVKVEKFKMHANGVVRAVKQCGDCVHSEERIKELEQDLRVTENKISQVDEARSADRDAVIRLVETWELQFSDIHHRNQLLSSELDNCKCTCEELRAQLQIHKKADLELQDRLESEIGKLVRTQLTKNTKEIVQFAQTQLQRVSIVTHKIEEISKSYENEITMIENKFQKDKKNNPYKNS